MSFMEKLADGIGAEWKTLGDVAAYSQTRVGAADLNAPSFVGVNNHVVDKDGPVDARHISDIECPKLDTIVAEIEGTASHGAQL